MVLSDFHILFLFFQENLSSAPTLHFQVSGKCPSTLLHTDKKLTSPGYRSFFFFSSQNGKRTVVLPEVTRTSSSAQWPLSPTYWKLKAWIEYMTLSLWVILYFVVAQLVKNLPATQETWVQSLGWEDALEKGVATHACILAWRIPWTEEPGVWQFMGSQKVRHNWTTKYTHTHTHTHTGTKGSLSAHLHFSLDKSSVTFLA